MNHGLKNTLCGFTLVELLVVVLVIGILAAVAIPQYQKAVEKSRVTQVLTAGKALWQAEEMYRLSNGTYTNELENLDINIHLPTEYTLRLRMDDGKKIMFTRTNSNFYYQILFDLPNNRIYCFTSKAASKASIDLCKSWGGEKIDGPDEHYRYRVM